MKLKLLLFSLYFFSSSYCSFSKLIRQWQKVAPGISIAHDGTQKGLLFDNNIFLKTILQRKIIFFEPGILAKYFLMIRSMIQKK